MSRDKDTGRSHNIKIDNCSFEMVEEFEYLGTTLTNKNSIQEQNEEQIEVEECLLSFCAESFVFQFTIQKCKNWDIHRHNIACCFVGM